MSYTDAIRFTFQGDKEKASRYVREARRLAFLLLRQTRDSNVQIARRTWTADDGTIIEVTVAGMEVSARITAPGGKERARWFEDFVAFTGEAAFEGGELVYYANIFVPNQNEEAPGWKTYFRSQNAPGYGAAPSPKGTYVAVYPRSTQNFYVGDMYLPGETTSHRNARGEYISYRTVASYPFFMPYRTLWSAYGPVVCHLGYVAHNTTDYFTNNEDPSNHYYILGAGLTEDGWLYTVNADMAWLTTYANAPGSAPRRSVYATPMMSNGLSIPMSLRRYRVRPVLDPRNNVYHYEVADGSQEVLWTGSVLRGFSRWIFSEDCTKAVMYAPPAEARALFIEAELVSTVSASHTRFEFSIDHEAGSATFASGEQTTAVAEENGVVMHVVPVANGYDYVIGEHTYQGFRYNGAGTTFDFSRIQYVDIKNGWLALLECTETYAGSLRTRTGAVKVYQNGELKATPHTFAPAISTAVPQYGPSLKEAFDDVLAQSPSGMTLLYLEIMGVIQDDNWDAPDSPFVAVTNNPYNPLPRTPGLGTMFGGCWVSTAGHEDDPGWGTWNLVFGNDGSNNPAYYGYVEPTTFLTPTGGCGTDKNLCFGTLAYGIGTARYVNYITDGNLEALSGYVIGSEKLTISVSVLGVPPLGQRAEF